MHCYIQTLHVNVMTLYQNKKLLAEIGSVQKKLQLQKRKENERVAGTVPCQ